MASQDLERPYRGLKPFTEADAPYFFGRVRETNLIIDNLMAYRMTILYGSSGVGKSSILQAGALPALRTIASRDQNRNDARRIIVLEFREWHGNAITALIQEITNLTLEAVTNTALQIEPPSPETSLYTTLTKWKNYFNQSQMQCDYLIILDQFEDYFRYVESNDSFGTQFVQILNDSTLPVNFLISIREDALGQLDAFKGRIPNLLNNRLRLLPLGEAQLKDAIERPVKAYNQKHQTSVEIEPDLVKVVLEKLTSVGRIDTSILQLVMVRLWDTEIEAKSGILRVSTLTQLGDVKSILSDYVNGIVGSLTLAEQSTVSTIFDRLVSPTGSKFAQRLSDLARFTGQLEEQLKPLLERLASEGSRLLRLLDQPEATYEILHDVLAAPINAWRSEFDRKQREQKRLADERRKLLRRIFIIVFIIFLVLFSWALYNLNLTLIVRAELEQARRYRWGTTAYQEYLRGNPLLGISLALQANEGNEPIPGGERTLSEIAYNSSIEHAFPVTFASTNISVSSISPKEPLIAVGLDDGYIHVWNYDDEVEVCNVQAHKSALVVGIVFNTSGTLALSYDVNNDLFIWEPATCKVRVHFSSAPYRVLAAAFDADGEHVTLGTTENTISYWDVLAGTETSPRISLGPDAVHALAFNLATRQIAGGVCITRDSQTNFCTASDLILWNITPQAITPQLRIAAHSDRISSLAISVDGLSIVSGALDGSLLIWQPEINRKQLLQSHSGQINTISIYPDGKTFVSGGSDKVLTLWDLATGEIMHKYAGYEGYVLNAQFILTSDRPRIVSSSSDQRVFVWDLESGAIIRHFGQNPSAVTQIAFSPDGKKALAGHSDGSALIWTVDTGNLLLTLPQQKVPVLAVAFSPDGKTVLTGGYEGRAVLSDAITGNEIREFRLADNALVTSIEYDPNGSRAAVGGSDGSVSLWDLVSGSLIQEFKRHKGSVNGLKFLPNSNQLVSGADDKLLMVWDLTPGTPASNEPVQTLTGHAAPVIDLDISNIGNIISADASGFIYQWNRVDYSRSQLQRLASFVNSVAVTSDGHIALASAGENNLTIMQNGQEFMLWQTYDTYESRTVTFAPDGTSALVGYSNGQLILWRLDSLDALKQWITDHRVVREFTCPEREFYEIVPLCAN